jgi:hypothetical protein
VVAGWGWGGKGRDKPVRRPLLRFRAKVWKTFDTLRPVGGGSDGKPSATRIPGPGKGGVKKAICKYPDKAGKAVLLHDALLLLLVVRVVRLEIGHLLSVEGALAPLPDVRDRVQRLHPAALHEGDRH